MEPLKDICLKETGITIVTHDMPKSYDLKELSGDVLDLKAMGKIGILIKEHYEGEFYKTWQTLIEPYESDAIDIAELISKLISYLTLIYLYTI